MSKLLSALTRHTSASHPELAALRFEILSLRFNHERFCDGHRAHRKTSRVRPLLGLRQTQAAVLMAG